MGWYTNDTKAVIGPISPWYPDRSYPSGVYVTHKTTTYGGLYMVKLGMSAPMGVPPSDNSQYWDLVVPGIQGETGPQGQTGDSVDSMQGVIAFNQLDYLVKSLGLSDITDDVTATYETIKLLIAMYGGGSDGTLSCQGLKEIVENKVTVNGQSGLLEFHCDQTPALTPPELVAPAPNAQLYNGTCTVGWTPGTKPISQYRVTAGSTLGGSDYYNSGDLANTVRTALIENIPTGGDTVYITLYYLYEGEWFAIRTTVISAITSTSFANYSVSDGNLTVVISGTASYSNGVITLNSETETYSYTPGILTID